MHGTAGEANPVCEHAGVRFETLVGGQERWVDVDQPVAPTGDEGLGQKTHEAGETDEVDRCGPQDGIDLALEKAAIPEVAMVDDPGRNPCLCRTLEPNRLRLVR